MKDTAKKRENMNGGRGVTRSMHKMEASGRSERERMAAMHHAKTLWVWWMVVFLGAWLAASAFTFSYGLTSLPAAPAGDRSVWLSLEARQAALFWSDLLCGVAVMILGVRSLRPGRNYSRWGICFIGVWLQFAPLVFWAPAAVSYLNDTLVGTLLIAGTILIPSMPGMMLIMQPGPEVPPGWTYNPSSWPQRSIMIGLAFAGWLVSRYLAAFQLGYLPHSWDPFFGDSSERVLTSEMSKGWPVSDAGLGAFAYTFEFLMGWMGGPARWRTMPWMVLFFAILVVPLGLVHIILVMSQPVVVGRWCTFCLLAAAIMLPMIPLALDEVIAMGQFMRRSVRAGKPFWRTFWLGGTLEGGGPDQRSPELAALPDRPASLLGASIWGMSFPRSLLASTLLGVWLLASPALLQTAKPAADSSHITGALLITVSVIAMGEVARAARWLNLAAGAWLVIAAFVLAGGNVASTINGVLAGALAMVLNLSRGPIRERYGTWDTLIR